MKQLKSIVVVVLLIGISFLACKKSSDNSKSNTELITQSSWKFDNAKVNGVDVSSVLETCQRDNILVFTSAGTGTLDEGASKCDAADPQTVAFDWNFATNETILHVSTTLFTGRSTDFTIVSLSETQLTVSQTIDLAGSSQTAVVTFKH